MKTHPFRSDFPSLAPPSAAPAYSAEVAADLEEIRQIPLGVRMESRRRQKAEVGVRPGVTPTVATPR